MLRVWFAFLLLTALTVARPFAGISARAADSLPAQLPDGEFWKLAEILSEPEVFFPGENYVSNEAKYADTLGQLQRRVKSGGVYIGVGPEQNFNHIAATQPKIAFIVDIRRQNALEHLMYRALFEMCPDRADFLSRLFSRKRPQLRSGDASIRQLMEVFATMPENGAAFEQNLKEIRTRLVQEHGFELTDNDIQAIAKIPKIFSQWGPGANYASDGPLGQGVANGTNKAFPTYSGLMTAADKDGLIRSYLANEDSYRFIRNMQMKGLIVPVVGDFGGPKAIRSIGQYLKDHGATVTTFYTSNVESELLQPVKLPPGREIKNGGWKAFMANVASLPLDLDSVFLRWARTNQPGIVVPILDTIQADKDGAIKTLGDLNAK
jgi:hypothetical protein